jgi:hypothetical protein
VAKNIEKIAAGLGAEIIGQIPDVGGGAFGAARLARAGNSAETWCQFLFPPGKTELTPWGFPQESAKNQPSP